MLAGFAPETCAELADAWRTGIEQPEYLALDTVYPDTLPFLQAMRAAGRDVVLISARQNADALRADAGALRYSAVNGGAFGRAAGALTAARRSCCAPASPPATLCWEIPRWTRAAPSCWGLPWIVLDRGFRSAVYWQAHGVQPAHDLHEAARRLQNLP